ncbi:thioredoxin domain-containing protein [Candidatus Woesearchaeota archaeon]|nr:thioredoxin domain-containing protein [Candidatus Woesearchaeota archaeon]
MINFNQNNLDKSTSPYLQQHKDNPIHWQEWSTEVLAHAKKNHKIILASIGYATCHWCHVMAQEAFSNKEIAQFLNQHFVCIKIDREQRPDIDHYFMNFCQKTQGGGGWPLNVFLAADQKPFLAVTYVPPTPRYGLPGFLDLLQHVKQSYNQHADHVPAYPNHTHQQEKQDDITEQDLITEIKAHFGGAGFTPGPQFPPHNTLLFFLSWYEQHKENNNTDIKDILEKILEAMAKGGLHDHLQGGFYRYCVDESWTIPHFEKMLYDQAMHLWVYSLAYKILKKQAYKTIAEKIITCLEDSYKDSYASNLYYAAHDADTDHHEGSTYVWDAAELQQHLTKDDVTEEEYRQFQQVYILDALGQNVEGKTHLIKRTNAFLPDIEKKLLQLRKKRKQPFTDKKYVTSWNALAGIGLLMAYRHCDIDVAKVKAKLLFSNILAQHYREGIVHHSSYNGKLQPGEFLEDYATVLLLATYLYEETDEDSEDKELKDLIAALYAQLQKFHNRQRTKSGQWIESKNNDFMEIPAQTYDHPTPSSASLASMAKRRAEIILEKGIPGKEYETADAGEEYKQPLQHDFYNLIIFMKHWHIIHTPQKIKWKQLPANSIQIYCSNHSGKIQDCYQHKCVEYRDEKQLITELFRVI